MNQKTIAGLAGVSSATVSRVVNNDPKVARETYARVQAVIAQTGYVPNTIAKSLRIRRTKTIGFVVPDIGNPFFPEVLRGVEEVCVAHRHYIVLGNTNEDPETELDIVHHLREKRVDGMICILVDGTGATARAAASTGDAECPIVLVDRHVAGHRGDSVLIDNAGGAYSAVGYLLELNHTRIGLIHGPSRVTPGGERLRGSLRATEDAGVAIRPEYIREGDFRPRSGYALTQELMRLPEPPTAIFAGNNLMTIGAFEALRDMGIQVPDQVSLIGFDDFPLAGYLSPALTVVERPMTDMGRIAAELLMARIEKRDRTAGRRVVLPTSLKVRESCRRLA